MSEFEKKVCGNCKFFVYFPHIINDDDGYEEYDGICWMACGYRSTFAKSDCFRLSDRMQAELGIFHDL